MGPQFNEVVGPSVLRYGVSVFLFKPRRLSTSEYSVGKKLSTCCVREKPRKRILTKINPSKSAMFILERKANSLRI
jgi:hypothetical protein